jgi:hypothetical protein
VKLKGKHLNFKNGFIKKIKFSNYFVEDLVLFVLGLKIDPEKQTQN